VARASSLRTNFGVAVLTALIDHVTHGVAMGGSAAITMSASMVALVVKIPSRFSRCTSQVHSFDPGQVAVQGSTKRFSKWRFISRRLPE
jgi:hypothetical protein